MHMCTLLKQIKSYIIIILIHNLVIFYIYSNTIQIYYYRILLVYLSII